MLLLLFLTRPLMRLRLDDTEGLLLLLLLLFSALRRDMNSETTCSGLRILTVTVRLYSSWKVRSYSLIRVPRMTRLTRADFPHRESPTATSVILMSGRGVVVGGGEEDGGGGEVNTEETSWEVRDSCRSRPLDWDSADGGILDMAVCVCVFICV